MNLLEEIDETLTELNYQIVQLRKDAERRFLSPVEMRDSKGGFLYAELLQAKANLLHAEALVKSMGENNGDN